MRDQVRLGGTLMIVSCFEVSTFAMLRYRRLPAFWNREEKKYSLKWMSGRMNWRKKKRTGKGKMKTYAKKLFQRMRVSAREQNGARRVCWVRKRNAGNRWWVYSRKTTPRSWKSLSTCWLHLKQCSPVLWVQSRLTCCFHLSIASPSFPTLRRKFAYEVFSVRKHVTVTLLLPAPGSSSDSNANKTQPFCGLSRGLSLFYSIDKHF